jgi:SOS-response transcriptional repressor LexA
MPMTRTLTPRQAELVAAVGRLTRKRGFSPSLEELGAELGVHRSRIAALARAAEARGALIREPRVPRSMRIPADNARSVPAPAAPRRKAQ